MFGYALLSFILASFFGPYFISFLKKMHFGQSIREEGPESHKAKNGTPTTGGIIFLVPILILSLVYGILVEFSYELFALVLLTIGFGLVGFLDDFIKIAFKRNLGFTAKQKLLAQIIITCAAFFLLYKSGLDTTLLIPGTNFSFDATMVGYFVIFMLLALGTTNATNLTDGLDGLLSGLAVISYGAFAIIALYQGNDMVATFCFIVAGALVAFLFFNANPAKVFMGDTGSLALGGGLFAIAVVLKVEIYLAFIGFVYVCETLSVIIQVISYKTRKKRVFPMTPIHHSFEKIGWAETKVVTRFWLLGIVSCILGLFLYTLPL